MKLNQHPAVGKRGQNLASKLAAFGFVSLAVTVGAHAQSADLKAAEPKVNSESYQTIYLTNMTQQNDANDLQTALRNVVPKARVYYVPSQSAFTVRADADDMQVAQKLVSDLDRSRKTYRLTYTIVETDGSGKRTGTQKFALIASPGSKTTMKQGSRVPLVTGTTGENSGSSSQVQYVDIGLSIEASLDGSSDGVRLRTKVEQSGIADEKSGVGAQDPVIHQSTLEATSTLAQGKPTVLGSLDVPGGARHQEIEVVAEVAK
jgi:type II secretory pathway component GspD/PulD (secretin)